MNIREAIIGINTLDYMNIGIEQAAVAQELEQVLQYLDGCWFQSLAPPTACRSILEQDTGPQTAPHEQLISHLAASDRSV